MRPFILDPLFQSVKALPGIGPRLAKLLENFCGGKVVNLLWQLPTGLIDRRFTPKIAQAPPGRIATITLTIEKHIPAPARNRPYRVRCSDDTGPIDLVFFHAKGDYLARQLPVGEKRIVSGRVEHFHGMAQIAHPDAIATIEEAANIQTVEPVYPLSAGLVHKTMVKAVRGALELCPDLPEWQNAAWQKKQGWAGWKESLLTAHCPQSEPDLEPAAKPRQRLAYDELLANQLALALVRQHQKKLGGRSFKSPGVLTEKALATLPFVLTRGQQDALAEINADMESEDRMLRLLQGDVGSGKTIVALLAMLKAIECGTQAALMAPTEILVRQHAQTITPIAEKLNLNVAVLTGRDKGKIRKDVLAQVSGGQAHIVIGTHSLFQKGVDFNNLGFVVIDEQHRFGVHQRLELSKKGRAADVLLMTATPIPRTLTLTAYGDMDISRLKEKPAGRKPIDTRLVSIERVPEVVEGLQRKIKDGARVYWVCPLVAESEIVDFAAAEARFEMLQKVFGPRTGLAHGRLKPQEKEAVMTAFAKGEIDVLVSTTVIEVGVDVPEATVMIIEHAERFGLSQLHQLRGRIGRSTEESTCLLLYSSPLGETASARLQTIRDTDDGFAIAEEDLKLRGAGEILGTRQSGLPEFRLANLAVHADLLAVARDDARLILEKDPALETPRGEALRVLLYLFEQDSGVRNLRSG